MKKEPSDASPLQTGLPVFLIDRLEEPWYRSLAHNIAEALRSRPSQPLEITSKPVAVKDIWGDYRYGRQAGISSALIHAGAAALLLTAGASTTMQTTTRRTIRFAAVEIAAYIGAKEPPRKAGGGGGDRSPLPASKGRAPRFAARQFVPPMAVVNNRAPKLVIEPTLIGPADTRLPDVNMPVWGDPFASIGPPSNGQGWGGGIGSGGPGGIGPGQGPGIGPGDGGSGFAGVYLPRGGVSAPVAIYQVEPEYSEEARKARFSGTVVLTIVVDEHGMPTNFKIVRSLGLGLDQKAVEAVRRWRFRPGMKDGKPVAVLAKIEVTFRLL